MNSPVNYQIHNAVSLAVHNAAKNCYLVHKAVADNVDLTIRITETVHDYIQTLLYE